MKILVVDDSEQNKKLLQVLLEAESFEVVTAMDGIEALELLNRTTIDAIISDILMPRMDGYQLCHEVRKNAKFNAVPLILYTATFTSPLYEEAALNFGADRFLRKPASAVEIIKALHELRNEPAGRRGKELQQPQELLEMREYSAALVRKLEESNLEFAAANQMLKERTVLAEFNAEIAEALTQKGLLSEILQLCTKAMVHYLDAAFARIWTYNKKTDVLELQASAGIYTHSNGGHARVPVGQFKIGLIASEQKPHLTNSVIGDPRVHDQEWARREGMVAFAGYPLIVEERLVGVMAMFAKKPLSQNTLDAMASVAKGVAAGIERKVAEDELRRSEERFRELAENINEVFFSINADGSALHYVSPAYEHVFGRKKETLYRNSHDWLNAVHPDDRLRVEQANQSHPEAFNDEYRIVRPDGQLRWIYARTFPVKNSAGKLVRSVGLAEDITERKQAEEKVQQNLQRIRALHDIDTAISSTVDLRAVLDVLLEKIGVFLPVPAATTIRLFNQSSGKFENTACRGIDESKWKTGSERTTGELSSALRETKNPIIIDNIQTDRQKRAPLFFRNQGFVTYLGVPLIAKDETVGVLGFYTEKFHEFTDQEIEFLLTLAGQVAIAIHNAQLFEAIGHSNAELGKTTRYLGKLLKQLGGLYNAMTPISPASSTAEMIDGIIDRIIDATGADACLIRVWGKNASSYPIIGRRGFPDGYLRQVVGASREGAVDWVIKNGEPIITGDIASEPRLKGKAQLELGFCSCALLPLKIHEEVRGVIHVSSRRLGYFDDRQKDHLLAVARQMSIRLENREYFYDLKSSRDELERANKVKDEFLSVITHELRTPINVIMGYTSLLLERAVEPEDGLKRISTATHDLLAMVDSILYATLLEANQLGAESQEFSVASLLTEVQTGSAAKTPKPINLNWNFSADLPPIKTDRQKLKHILNTLIDNALKFTEKGTITVSAKLLEQPGNRTELGADGMAALTPSDPKGWFEFKVADTGIGIPTEILSHIFDKFYQLDSSRTRRYEGVGLGLYIVKKFVEILGGRVEVESEMGKGSSFTVTIPGYQSPTSS